MKFTRCLLFLSLAFLFVIASCAPVAATQEAVVEAPSAAEVEQSTEEPAPTAVEEVPIVLQIIAEGSTLDLTMEDVKALPSVEGYGGIKSSTGQITLPKVF